MRLQQTLIIVPMVLFFVVPVYAQRIHYTEEGFVACSSRDALEDVLGVGDEMDQQVLKKKLENGQCFFLEAGTEVFVLQSEWGIVKIRPRATNQSYWTVREAVSPFPPGPF